MFASVHALFSYCGPHRDLLLRAKDLQDPRAIFCFYFNYAPLVRSMLRQLIERENIEMVILPRLGLRRLLKAQWHPADFWRELLRDLADERPLRVVMRPPHFGSRRALLSSTQRRRDVEQRTQTSMQRVSFPAQEKELRSVLFVDDVLTSGGTLLREWEELVRFRESILVDAEATQNKQSLRLPASVNAHILTVFRTPVSDALKGNSSEFTIADECL